MKYKIHSHHPFVNEAVIKSAVRERGDKSSKAGVGVYRPRTKTRGGGGTLPGFGYPLQNGLPELWL